MKDLRKLQEILSHQNLLYCELQEQGYLQWQLPKSSNLPKELFSPLIPDATLYQNESS